ncbi:MAG TPA: zf-HC2 domain-containing protein [Pyrinomonadaceae bacterium]
MSDEGKTSLSDAMRKDCSCKNEEIAAYLDGELDAAARLGFEQHLKQCRSCVVQLDEQKRLLCELDYALGGGPPLALPKDFAQVVAAHAESDLSGVRRRSEHGFALRVCAVLALLAFALLGGSALRESVAGPLGLMARRVWVLFDISGHMMYNAGAGLAVISRGVGGHLFLESHPLVFLSGFILLAALALLLVLVSHTHRTRVTR